MAVRNDFAAGEVLAAQDLNDTFASKVDYATPTNAQAGTAYTFVADDAERITTASNGSAVTFTIPPQSSVGWVDDTILRVVNYGAGALTVAGGSGVTVTNTATVINQYGGGAAIRTGSDAWTFVPFGAGEAPINVTGGNEVVTVGGYRYHLFTGSSSLVISSPASLSCDILVVGAGGGGGNDTGGGGGGGAVEPASGYTSQTLSAGSYTVTIASGGSGSTDVFVKGGSASSTSFAGTSTITANGGGGGGSNSNQDGAAGGSGGGGSRNSTSTGAGGTASGSNTNAGGAGTSSPSRAGGGGGATGAGASGSTGNGGAGITMTNRDSNLTAANFSTFSGMTTFSAGGGGGGDGETGGTSTGGGTGGGTNGTATNATSFGSGGGGGSGASVRTGGNGYGGLVIVRYAV